MGGPCAAELPLIELGPLQIFSERIFWEDKPIKVLRPQARRFLLDLVDHADEFVTATDLESVLWPEPHGSLKLENVFQSLSVAKHELRSAFRDVDSSFDRIEYRKWLGYRWRESSARPNFERRHGIEIDERRMMIRYHDQVFDLGPSLWRLLELLWDHSPGAATDRECFRVVRQFGRDRVEGLSERALGDILKVNMHRIRKRFLKINPSFSGLPRVPGVGYAWIPEDECALLLTSTGIQPSGAIFAK